MVVGMLRELSNNSGISNGNFALGSAVGSLTTYLQLPGETINPDGFVWESLQDSETWGMSGYD